MILLVPMLAEAAWWNSSNITQGFVFLTNKTFSDTFEYYMFNEIDDFDTNSSWSLSGDASAMSTTSTAISGQYAQEIFFDISKPGFDSFISWNAVELALENFTHCAIHIGNINTSQLATNGIIFSVGKDSTNHVDVWMDNSLNGSQWLILDRYNPDSQTGSNDWHNVSHFEIYVSNMNLGDFNLTLDEAICYNASQYMNTSNWNTEQGFSSLARYDNGYGYNTTYLFLLSEDNSITFINLSDTAYENYEMILRGKYIHDFGSEMLMIQFGPDQDQDNLTYTTSSAIASINGNITTFSNPLPFDHDRYFRIMKNNSFCSVYDSDDAGISWTLRMNASCTAQPILKLGCRASSCYFDNFIMRELPGTLAKASTIYPSYIYDDDNSESWENASFSLLRSTKSSSAYSPIVSISEPTDTTGIYAMSSDWGYYQVNVTVCDASGCAWNLSSNIVRIGMGNLNTFIYDEDTGAMITSIIDILVGKDDYSERNSTSSGAFNFTDLEEDSYTISFSDGDFYMRSYPVSIYSGQITTLNAYLINSSDTVIFTIKDDSTGKPVEGATLTILKFLGVGWTTVGSFSTDVTGRVTFSYDTSARYEFTITKSGYLDKQFILNPIIYSTYDVYIEATSTFTDSSDYSGITIINSPTLFYEGINNVSVLFSEPNGTLEYYGFNISYPGGFNSSQNSISTGSNIHYSINVTNASFGNHVNWTIYYKLTSGNQKNFVHIYEVVPVPTVGLLLFNRNHTYGLGILERAIILTFILIIVGGTATYFTNFIMAGLIDLFVMGYMAYIGFISAWLIYLPVIAGIIIIIGIATK